MAENNEKNAPGPIRRLLARPGVLLVLALAAVTAAAERSLITGAARLGGGALVPAWGGASDLWDQYLSGFHPVGLGTGAGSPPYVGFLALLSTVLFGKPWLAVAVLLLGIMQVPVLLITIPVIIFVFSTEGLTAATIVFGIYTFIAGLSDNVLKPLLLGRGVEVPMPVVLIGALGGMVTGGIIGLFMGPVLLAVGYMLFWQWVEDPPSQTEPGNQQQT